MIKNFFKSEFAIGVCLLLATIAALIISNSSFYNLYQSFLAINLPINLDFLQINKNLTLLEWINDAAMAVFFLLVGLELKHEILIGELSSRQKISLPAIAACGGVLIPMIIFALLNYDNADSAKGFAIPCATDIAFAYGMISLFGKSITNSAKIFLVALAVLDDLIAIIIIAFFYSQNIKSYYLLIALIIISALYLLNLLKVKNIFAYLFLGILLWLALLESGIHATLTGVLLAMFIPLQFKNKPIAPKLAKQISPLVNFIILPIFAFANAGVKIENFSSSTNELRSIRQMVDQGMEILNDNNFEILEFGHLLHKGWIQKKRLSEKVSSDKIDEMYDAALNAGAIGGKILGAGGGGFMLLFAPPEMHLKITERLKNLVKVNFKFEDSGSKIVLYQPNGL